MEDHYADTVRWFTRRRRGITLKCNNHDGGGEREERIKREDPPPSIQVCRYFSHFIKKLRVSEMRLMVPSGLQKVQHYYSNLRTVGVFKGRTAQCSFYSPTGRSSLCDRKHAKLLYLWAFMREINCSYQPPLTCMYVLVTDVILSSSGHLEGNWWSLWNCASSLWILDLTAGWGADCTPACYQKYSQNSFPLGSVTLKLVCMTC